MITRKFVLISLVLFLVFLIFTSLMMGSVGASQLFASHSLLWTVLWEIRMPRTLLALMAGASLGFTGAVLQGFFQNSLVDPGIMGISTGSALAAVCSVVFGITWFGDFTLPLFGMMGAILTTAILYGLIPSSPSPSFLILIGIALSSFFGAMIPFILNLSQNPYASLEALFWLMGSYTHHTMQDILLMIPFLSLGCYLLWNTRHSLDMLSLGQDTAVTMGYRQRKIHRFIILGTALIMGPLVAMSGVVGFIGLVIPHLLRFWVGQKPSILLLPSALAGGALSLLADLCVRLFTIGMELKVGVVTSLIGAPFMILLLYKNWRHSSCSSPEEG